MCGAARVRRASYDDEASLSTFRRLSYIKNALALDKIGGLEDDDSDCDTNDGGTPFGLAKKKAIIETKF